MKLDIYGDGISYVTDEVSSIHPSESNLNEFTRAKFVTDLAAVSRGLDRAKNPERRYQSLLKEAAPTSNEIDRATKLDLYTCPECSKECQGNQDDSDIIVECKDCGIMCDKVSAEQPDGYDISEWAYKIKKSPSRPLEFLPVVVDLMLSENSIWKTNYYGIKKYPIFVFKSFADLSNGLLQHSYVEPLQGNNNLVRLYTNMRACLNAGIPYDSIPYNTAEELKNFRALKASIPMFVFNHLITHTALSKEAQSDRVTANTNHWLPSDFKEKVHSWLKANPCPDVHKFSHLANSLISEANRDNIVSILLSLGQKNVQNFFKDIGYKKEIYHRAMLEFRYKEVVITAWWNNPKTFRHFTIEREAFPKIHKSWVQEQTRLLAECIRDIIIS